MKRKTDKEDEVCDINKSQKTEENENYNYDNNTINNHTRTSVKCTHINNNNKVNIDFEKDKKRELIRASNRSADLLAQIEFITSTKLPYNKNHVINETDYITSNVLCPLCKEHNLIFKVKLFMCICGFNLDTGDDKITFEHLEKEIITAYNSHKNNCKEEPYFHVENQFGISMLCLSCNHCNNFSVVT